MIIQLIRHAESESNTGQVNASILGDHNVCLTEKGQQDAKLLGYHLNIDGFLSDSIVYVSPYIRTLQTLENIFIGANLNKEQRPRVYEDPQLREVEWGLDNHDPHFWDKLEALKEKYGSFYIRRYNGESCADCYDRCASFIDSMMRQVIRKKKDKIVIISHGLTIRCFVMRFMHLTVAEFETLRNPKNCDIITISTDSRNPQLTNGKWGVEGLRFMET